MAELQNKPACRLNVSEEQYRAVGHMTLQWALLEADIDREIVWLNKQSNIAPQNLRAKFEDRITGWRRLAADVYVDRPELIEGVSSVSEKARVIKAERDKLVHCHLTADGTMIRVRDGRVLEISDEATAAHIEDLACRISAITDELLRHLGRVARVFTDNDI